MLDLPITLITGSILTLCYVVLTMRVVFARVSNKVSLGTGPGAATIALGENNAPSPLLVPMRAHGNFAEYVPLSLVMMGLVEGHGGNKTMLMALAATLVVARLMHAVGIGMQAPNAMRGGGVVLQMTVLIVLAVAGLLAAAAKVGWV